MEGKLLPYFTGWRLDEIRPRHIEALLATHPDLSPASRNRILSALSALLKHARRLGYVKRNAAGSVPHAREDVLALPLVPLADQQRLLSELPAERRLLFLTALDTGARLGELLALRWRDIDWERGALLIRRSKNRRPRIVRAARRLVVALRAAAPSERSLLDPRIFEEAIGADQALRWAWRKSFKRAAAAIGHPDLRIHDMRHYADCRIMPTRSRPSSPARCCAADQALPPMVQSA